MRRISPVRVFLIPVVFGAAILGTAAVAAAQPVCNSAIGEHLMSSPDPGAALKQLIMEANG